MSKKGPENKTWMNTDCSFGCSHLRIRHNDHGMQGTPLLLPQSDGLQPELYISPCS
jgi:hypothetical protein